MTPISRPAVFAGLPANAFASVSPIRSIAPAVGMPSAMWPMRPRSCSVSNSPARTTFSAALMA